MAEGDSESSFLLIPIAEKNGVANQVGLLNLYSGVLFNWERFIQIRMAYFALTIYLLPLFSWQAGCSHLNEK